MILNEGSYRGAVPAEAGKASLSVERQKAALNRQISCCLVSISRRCGLGPRRPPTLTDSGDRRTIIMAREARWIVRRSGGPEEKLRGRPPPPVEPRSGPWRRTGSESGAGRTRTRRRVSMTHCTQREPLQRERHVAARSCNLRKRRCAAAFVTGGRHFSARSRRESVGWRSRSMAISCNGSGSRPSCPDFRSRSTARN